MKYRNSFSTYEGIVILVLVFSISKSQSRKYTIQEVLFINSHILDPTDTRNQGHANWTSRQWSKWLLERDRCDGQLRRNGYGTLLKGRNISVIVGEPGEVLQSLKGPISTFSVQNRKQKQRHKESSDNSTVTTVVSSRNFTIYLFVRLEVEDTGISDGEPEQFVEYSVYKAPSTKFSIIRRNSQLKLEFNQTHINNPEPHLVKLNFTVRIYYRVKQFELLSGDSVHRPPKPQQSDMNLTTEETETLLKSTLECIWKFPSLIVLVPMQENISNVTTYKELQQSIEAICGSELMKLLPKMNSREKYVCFELVKRTEIILGEYTKLELLSGISVELSSLSSNCNGDYGPKSLAFFSTWLLVLIRGLQH